MSSEPLLRAVNIGKTYVGTKNPLGALLHALTGVQRGAIRSEYSVLCGIDLEIVRGETVGILGRNGAGKTTLLGILGDVIHPTEGEVHRYGRVATLLGLATGFNSNFTGRENAYLFCSIHGFTRGEAEGCIGAIEAFADVGRYFDLALRTYSSGMQARLAFACAVHVSADLIIIDETLAVGDANFRIKCYQKIRQMQAEGQTFLLVSHNQNVVANYCTRGIVLEGGRKVFDGPTFEALEVYKRVRTESAAGRAMKDPGVSVRAQSSDDEGAITLKGFSLLEELAGGETYGVVSAELVSRRDCERVSVNFGISNQEGIVVCAVDGARVGGCVAGVRAGGKWSVQMRFAKQRLLKGRYFVSCIVHEVIGDVIHPLSLYQNVLSFEIPGGDDVSGIADLCLGISVIGCQEPLVASDASE